MWALNTVVSAIKLSLLIGLGLIYLSGQGWLAVGPLLHGSLTIKKRNIPLLEEIPLMLLAGLIINYGITLCFQSLTIGLLVGAILSIFGICCFLMYVIRFHKWQLSTPSSLNKWIGTTVVSLLFLSPIMAEPLFDWDARSIWFFHAKMIYTAGSIGRAAGWQDSFIIFSHPDYPNLVPALAAQLAHVVGLWNVYLPKAALFFMLIPAITWLFTFARRSFSFVLLLLLIPFSIYPWIWNGYMDGYLALYFSIAMLLLGRYMKSSQLVDLVSGVCCLLALLYIKNEGALAALAGLASLIIFIFFQKIKSYPVKNIILPNWKYFLACIIGLLPFVVWNVYKQHWNLSNDLGIGTAQSFTNFIDRLKDGSYVFVLKYVFGQIEGALLMLVILYSATVVWNISFARESLPAILTAGIYCLGMIIVYLLTVNNLQWQIDSSISRTMLPINCCIFIGCYYILNKIENHDKLFVAKI
jgi:hypothetical protein